MFFLSSLIVLIFHQNTYAGGTKLQSNNIFFILLLNRSLFLFAEAFCFFYLVCVCVLLCNSMCAFWPFFTSLNKTYVSTTRERERVRGFVSVHFAVYIHKMHYAWIYAPFFFAIFSSLSCVWFCFAMRLYIELHHLRILLRRIQSMLIFFLFLLAKSYKCLKLRQSVSCFTEWILAYKKN